MFFLSLEERVEITRFVVEKAAGRVAVVSSGHISDSLEDQAKELNEIAKAGPDAVIMLTADGNYEFWQSQADIEESGRTA